MRALGVTGDHGTRVVATRLVGGAPAAVVVERTETWDGAMPGAAHSTPGVAAVSTTWQFAEGVTSADAITYLALVNPSGTATTATVTYRHTNGAMYPTTVAVPAGSRATLLANAVPGLGSASFRTAVTASQAVVVERVTYWPSSGLVVLGSGVLALDTGPPGAAWATTLEDVAARELARRRPFGAMAGRPESERLATREGLPYTGLVEATPLGPMSEARAAGLVSAEELAAREAAATARAAAAMPGDVTLSGVTTSSAGWYGAHLTLGRRP